MEKEFITAKCNYNVMNKTPKVCHDACKDQVCATDYLAVCHVDVCDDCKVLFIRGNTTVNCTLSGEFNILCDCGNCGKS